MQGIFISYRRQDSQSAAGRLADDIKENLAGVSVFRDVETIEAGKDFVDAIQGALQACGVMLAVIGPRWLSVTDGTGGRRLDNPDDFIRLEIATALKRPDMCVIPVLVEGAQMPPADELPDDLQALARRNAFELTDPRWDYDVSRLAATVRNALGVPTESPLLRGHRWRWFAGVSAALIVAGYLGWSWRAPNPSAVTAALPEAVPASATSMSDVSTDRINASAASPAHAQTPPPANAQPELCPGQLSINRTLPTPFTCRCDSTAMQSGAVWGSDFYIDDSKLCRAAAHAGVIAVSGGEITVVREPGRALYVGTRRNGVESYDYGAHSDTIRFVGAPQSAPGPERCPDHLSINRNLPTPFTCRCDATDMQSGAVWGSDFYSDDSKLCRAAAHAGVVAASGGVMTAMREPGRALYIGTRRNGVESYDYGAHSDSLRFVGAPPPAPGPERCPDHLSINRNLPTPFTCRCDATDMQSGAVWGSDFYTDDSNLCRAGAHVGVISARGGVVTVVREPGRALYSGSRRNGVESYDYGAHTDSIRFIRRLGVTAVVNPAAARQRDKAMRP